MRRLRLPAALLSVVAFVAGCADDAELDTLKPEGEYSEQIDNLIDPIFIVAFLVFFLILGLTLFMWAKYRVTEYEEGDWPEQVHGKTSWEIGWTFIPFAIMAAIGAFTWILLSDLNATEANALPIQTAEGEVMWDPHVVVVGQQWWWEYRYYFDADKLEELDDANGNPAKDLPPADIVTAGQLVMPIGEEVELTITSRDVIHSHWIPALNGKRDAVPGRFSPWKIQANDPGLYFGQCTEFCGLSHSRMRMQAVALTPEDFQEWVTAQLADAETPPGAEAWLEAYRAADGSEVEAPEATGAQRGLVAFTQNCASCHLVQGVNDLTYDGATQVSGAAPNLTHFASRTTLAGGILDLYNPDGTLNRNNLESWLRNPEAIKANAAPERGMPNLGLSEETIDDLVDYLETLGPRPSDEMIAATQVD